MNTSSYELSGTSVHSIIVLNRLNKESDAGMLDALEGAKGPAKAFEQ